MSIATDNFLKALYLLRDEQVEAVMGTQLAARLEISSAAVTDMARKLAERGLVAYTPYREMELTPAGEELALKIIRRHRLWELFLQQVLDMDLKMVHEEAERLEHHASEELMNRIDVFLGHPDFDPHGEPIPRQSGSLPEAEDLLELQQAEPGKTYLVARIIIREPEVFDLFARYGIHPGQRLQVVQCYDFDKSMELEVGRRKVLLSEGLVQKIFLNPLN